MARKQSAAREDPTPERFQHDEMDLEGRDPTTGALTEASHYRVVTQTPLDRYRARSLLDQDPQVNGLLWIAGDRLRGDHYVAGLAPQVVADLQRVARGNGGWSEQQLAARKRYREAAVAVDLDLFSCLQHVCCLDGTAPGWAAARGERGRAAETAGMAILRLGLRALARHYGLMKRGA